MASLETVPGMMKVLIEGAQDLDDVSQPGGPPQQPFYVLECGNQRSRSRPAASGGPHGPAFNTAHKFALTSEVLMRVAVRDDVTKELIGEGLIDLGRRARALGLGRAPRGGGAERVCARVCESVRACVRVSACVCVCGCVCVCV
jgi:hypothetical protein